MSASYTPSGGSSATFFTGITFSKSGDVWKASPTKYWPRGGQTMFLAYSAPDLGMSVSWNTDAATGFSVSSMPDNRTAQVDIMYGGTGNLSQNSGAAVMSFKHAQSLLRFTGVCDVAYNSSTNVGVTITSITMSALRYRGSFSVSQATNATLTPTWSASTTGAATAYSGTGNLTTSAADLGVGYMVYPQAPVAITINYTLHNGKDASGNNADLARSFSFTPSGTWAAGNSYTYAISFAESEISVSASLNAWEAASQTWFYATADAVSQKGANFNFSSSSPMWWRLSGSDSYEPLVYESGTWGSSVRFETASYFVTVTAANSNYTVSYETKAPPKDLSMYDIFGVERGTRTTANCYIVKERGTYRIPLVYGNAIVNGETNSSSYNMSSSDFSYRFVNHVSNAITNPYIENNTNCTATKAELLYQTAAGMIASVDLVSGDDCRYIEFRVANIPNTRGNAVLVLKNNSYVIWSWMIWLNSDELSNVQFTNSDGYKYTFLSEVLGTYQVKSNLNSYPKYEFGRKDPFPHLQNTVYDINGNAVSISIESSQAQLYQGIRNPKTYYKGSNYSSYYGWTGTSGSYYRETTLWNTAYTSTQTLREGTPNDQADSQKSIYDPCPPGYMVPTNAALRGATITTKTFLGLTAFSISGADAITLPKGGYISNGYISGENSECSLWSYTTYYQWSLPFQIRSTGNGIFYSYYSSATGFGILPVKEQHRSVSRYYIILEDSGSQIVNKAYFEYTDGTSLDVTNRTAWSINSAGKVEGSCTEKGITYTDAKLPSATNVRLQAHYITSPFAWNDGVTQGEVTVDIGLAREAYLVYYLQTGAITSRNTMILHTDNTSATNVSDNIYIRTLSEGTAHVSATAACGTIPNQITLNVYDIDYTLEFGGFISQWNYAGHYRYNGWENNILAVWGPWYGPEYDIEYDLDYLDITEEEYSNGYASRELVFGLFMEARAHGSLIFRHACWWIDRTPVTVEWSWHNNGNWTSGWIGNWSFSPIGYITSSGMYEEYDDGNGHDGGALHGSIDIDLRYSGYDVSVYMRLGAQLNGAWIYTPSIYIHEEE